MERQSFRIVSGESQILHIIKSGEIAVFFVVRPGMILRARARRTSGLHSKKNKYWQLAFELY